MSAIHATDRDIDLSVDRGSGQAAPPGLVPKAITHFVCLITSSAEYGGTSQVWVQADAGGIPERVASEAPGTDYWGVAMPRRIIAFDLRNAALFGKHGHPDDIFTMLQDG